MQALQGALLISEIVRAKGWVLETQTTTLEFVIIS
jgi:hypothetical protein